MVEGEKDKYKLFDDLINRYRRLIRKLCWRYSLGSENWCDKLVQDCYIAIWSHLPSLRPDAHPLQRTAWVVLQCRSVFSHRRRGKIPDWISIDEQLADSLSAPDDSGRREMIEGFSADLPPKEQRLLTLMLEGYGQKEIAEKMNMNVEAVKKMRQRLIKKIRVKFKV